jgi:hypothetical protein
MQPAGAAPRTQVEKACTAAQALLDIEGVVGVGKGEWESGACVVVFVAMRTPRLEVAIPARILGIPVAIRDAGAFIAY